METLNLNLKEFQYIKDVKQSCSDRRGDVCISEHVCISVCVCAHACSQLEPFESEIAALMTAFYLWVSLLGLFSFTGIWYLSSIVKRTISVCLFYLSGYGCYMHDFLFLYMFVL